MSIAEQIAAATQAQAAQSAQTQTAPVVGEQSTAPQTQGAAEGGAPQPEPELTRAQALEKALAAEIAKKTAAEKRILTLTSQIQNIELIEKIVRGARVRVNLGRAETARKVDATVAHVKVDDKGNKKFKLLVGTDEDLAIEVVGEGQIVEVLALPNPQA